MTAGAASVLAVITARGGSKGVPDKNIRQLAGRPLIEWTIEAALQARCVTRTIVSTDAPEIAVIAARAGAEIPFMRPAELATDVSGSTEVVAHALAQCPGYDFFVLLQPTSPLRTGADLDAAFDAMNASGAEGCVAISEAEESPWLMFRRFETGRLAPLLPPWPGGMRRQELPPVYVLNGAFYFMRSDAFHRSRRLVSDRTIGHVLPRERAVDIDSLADFDQAGRILATYGRERAQ